MDRLGQNFKHMTFGGKAGYGGPTVRKLAQRAFVLLDLMLNAQFEIRLRYSLLAVEIPVRRVRIVK